MDLNQDILQVGSVLDGRYSILSCEGKSGNAFVFKAQHQLMGRAVAIRVLDWKLKDRPESLKRFQNEARMLASLDHPNVVALRDFGVMTDGLPYLVTDYLEGKSLAEVIKEEKVLAPRRAVGIFVQLCDGLQYIHKQGIVNRDLQPSKIMIVETSDGGAEVKIVDFGVAKLEPTEDQREQELTKTGEQAGSPLYMSPEQLARRPLNRRSDIYSLGCVMYETVSGRPPFEAEQLLQSKFNEGGERPRSVREIVPGIRISSELESLILRALEKEPEKRYKSIEDLRRDLQATPEYKELFQDQPQVGATLRKSGKTARTALAVVVLLIVSVSAILWYVSTDTGAVQFAELLVGIQEKLVGRKDPALIPKLNFLVDSLVRAGRYDDAAGQYGRIVQISQGKYGQDSVQAAEAHTDLGVLYCKAKQFKLGNNEIMIANKIIQQRFEAGSAESADAYSHLGSLCLHVAGAEDWFGYFYRIGTVTHMTLAHKFESEGKPDQALANYRKALNDLEMVNKQLPSTMMELNQASVYCSIGRLSKGAEAERAYDAAFNILEKYAYSKDQKSSKARFAALQLLSQIEGSTLQFTAERKAVLGTNVLSRSLAIRKKALGPEDISVAGIARLLGGIYEGQLSVTADKSARQTLAAKARDNFTTAVNIYQKVRGPEDPDVARIANSLADCEITLGLFDNAQRHYKQVIEIAEKHPDSLHDLIMVALPARAGILVNQNRLPEAEKLYKRAVEINTKEAGPECLGLMQLLQYLATCEYSAGRRTEALQHCRQAVQVYKNGRAGLSGAKAKSFQLIVGTCLSMMQEMGRFSEVDELRKSLGLGTGKQYRKYDAPDRPVP